MITRYFWISLLSGVFVRSDFRGNANNNEDVLTSLRLNNFMVADVRENMSEDISLTCWNHTQLLNSEAQNGNMWARKMLDAAGKPGSNILGGETTFIGSYPECVETVAMEPDGQRASPKELFQGRYCLVSLSRSAGNVSGFEVQSVSMGVCVPSTCSESDTSNIVSRVLQKRNTSFAVSNIVCQIPQEYSAGAIIVLAILALFLLVMFVSTVYDVICIQRPKWKRQSFNSDESETPQISEINETSQLIPNNTKDHVRRLLASFSVYTNTVNLLDVKEVSGSIQCINGIRFLSLTWIILYHTYWFAAKVEKNMKSHRKAAFKDLSFQVIENGQIVVDTFFTLSGMLVSYQSLTKLKTNNGKMNWVRFFCHRLWRLTPQYMLVLMVCAVLYKYMGSGPLWSPDGSDCSTWWMNLIYINNFTRNNPIMLWTWYLACDMQFYLLSPFIFLAFYRSKIAGTVTAFVFLLASFITTGIVSTKHELFMIRMDSAFFNEYYNKPYCRIGPYIVGLCLGQLLYETALKIRIQKWLNIILWLVSTLLAMAVLYAPYAESNGYPATVGVRALYNTLGRTVWAMCIGWVTVTCVTGNAGFINTVLSWKVFVPLSRLSYVGYLVHPVVANVVFESRKELFFMSNLNITVMYLSLTTGSLLVTFIVYLAFEAPMVQLEKSLLQWLRENKK